MIKIVRQLQYLTLSSFKEMAAHHVLRHNFGAEAFQRVTKEKQIKQEYGMYRFLLNHLVIFSARNSIVIASSLETT